MTANRLANKLYALGGTTRIIGAALTLHYEDEKNRFLDIFLSASTANCFKLRNN